MEAYYIGAAALIAVTAWAQIDASRHAKRLRALRANAFITNSRGHRVRYVNATPAERARAEGEA